MLLDTSKDQYDFLPSDMSLERGGKSVLNIVFPFCNLGLISTSLILQRKLSFFPVFIPGRKYYASHCSSLFGTGSTECYHNKPS